MGPGKVLGRGSKAGASDRVGDPMFVEVDGHSRGYAIAAARPDREHGERA